MPSFNTSYPLYFRSVFGWWDFVLHLYCFLSCCARSPHLSLCPERSLKDFFKPLRLNVMPTISDLMKIYDLCIKLSLNAPRSKNNSSVSGQKVRQRETVNGSHGPTKAFPQALPICTQMHKSLRVLLQDHTVLDFLSHVMYFFYPYSEALPISIFLYFEDS